MDYRPCVVVDGVERWPGTVLAWGRSDGSWRGVVRFSRMTPEGWPLTREHGLDATGLEPA